MRCRAMRSPRPPTWWRYGRISSRAAIWSACRSTESPAGWGSRAILPARSLNAMLCRGSPSSDMDIEINIDRLRLEGVEPMRQEELVALVQDELSRLIETHGMPEALRRGGVVEI